MYDDTLIPKWLTLQSASVYCGLSVRYLQNLIADGAIDSRLVRRADGKGRGRRLIRRQSLDALIEGKESCQQ